jgi:hypothetical protein
MGLINNGTEEGNIEDEEENPEAMGLINNGTEEGNIEDEEENPEAIIIPPIEPKPVVSV